jgi:hypothetical protein
MFPALWSNRHAVALIAVIGGLLLLPMMLGTVGQPPRASVYTGMRIEVGAAPHDDQVIFDEKEPVDILFVGSSLLVRGVDVPYVQAELSKKLGRPARVRYIALKWHGLDMQYMLLRDFLEHRKASLVVMVMPNSSLAGDAPHIQAYRWMRWEDFPRTMSGLSMRSRLAVYGMEVLGSPRQVLDYLRPNVQIQNSELIDNLGTQHESAFRGYFGAPYVPESQTPPSIPVDSMIANSESDPRFSFNGKPLGPYHLHWAKEIGDITKQHGAAFAMMHIPEDTEHGMTTVPERMYWPKEIGFAAPVIGIPSATLFADTPAASFDHYYFDQHFNDNGKELFTHAITPAILEVYARSVRQ